MDLQSRSCELDIIPTNNLKEKCDSFIKPITHIVNLLMKNGEFHDEWKNATLQPLQKKVAPSQRSLITDQLVIWNIWPKSLKSMN